VSTMRWPEVLHIRYTAVPLFIPMLATLVLGPTTSGQNEVDSKEAIKVQIGLGHKEFHLGEPIELKLEISNVGQKPLLIANSVSLYGNGDALLEIELRGGKGLLSPRMSMVGDCFPTPEKNPKPASEIVLKSFLVLRPGTSYVQRLPIYEHLSALKYGLSPGNYTLRTYYSSNGLLYPSMCGTQGLKDDDVKTLPFKTWHGKVGTNEVSFTVLPPS
jgi:hypothetical protein